MILVLFGEGLYHILPSIRLIYEILRLPGYNLNDFCQFINQLSVRDLICYAEKLSSSFLQAQSATKVCNSAEGICVRLPSYVCD